VDVRDAASSWHDACWVSGGRSHRSFGSGGEESSVAGARRVEEARFSFELCATRSLRFEYAEALRAEGVEGSGSFCVDGFEDGTRGRSSERSSWKVSETAEQEIRGRTYRRFMEFGVRVALRSSRH
jgi:hypothetical protein